MPTVNRPFQKRALAFVACSLFVSFQYVTAQVDSTRYLDMVEVRSNPLPEISHQTMPVQVLNGASLNKIQALQISDAIKRFAGVNVKDYGGIGGLKTVSVRGLGANHTAISYDGMTLTDAQSGQIDLGKFSLRNINNITLAIGSPDSLLLPARAFASASVLSINTAPPLLEDNRKASATVDLRHGSFGMLATGLNLQNRWRKNIATTFLGEWQHAHGQYPYTLDYGGLTSREKRTNSDVNIFHAEENIFLSLPRNSTLTTKIYYYQSERGLPGATIYYNPHASQRLWDRNFFIQSRHEKTFSKKIQTLLNIKYTTSYLRYLDPDYLGSAGKLENEYRQKETYASAAGIFKAGNIIHIALSTDGAYNTMDANLYQFAYPTRYTWLTALNAKLKNKHLDLQMGLVNTTVSENVESGTPAKDYHKRSPSFIAAYRPLANDKLLLRFFYKSIFRMPTFNDLYYTGVGNNTLKPENTRQLNLGVAFASLPQNHDLYFSGSIDVYRNRVTDKIVALPTKNIFIWSMMNIGITKITGTDIVLKTGYTPAPSLTISLEGSYTYQDVIDVTDPNSKTYQHQIAYTPKHSGSAVLAVNSRIVDIAYNFLYAGRRYTLNHNIPTNRMPGYREHGITMGRSFSTKKAKYTISAEALNLLNTSYEVVRNFPMPGRSYRLNLSAKL